MTREIAGGGRQKSEYKMEIPGEDMIRKARNLEKVEARVDEGKPEQDLTRRTTRRGKPRP